MIAVDTADRELKLEEQTDQELYEALREHIGSTVLVRRQRVERVGVLEWLNFQRNTQPGDVSIYYRIGEESDYLCILHRVEVKLDGVWKVLSIGSEVNREL